MQNYRVHHHQAQVGGSGESRGGSDQNRQRLREENEKSVLKANSTAGKAAAYHLSPLVTCL